MSWLKSINPTPAFPAYTGPHKVGSIDIEIPTSELENPSDDAPPADIPTVAFRVFYPCRQDSEQKAVRWIPSPQREYVAAYARFLGANSAFASVFSLFPQLLQFTSIPVHSNADILEPNTKSKRWPVMMFSHGLGGSRNAYSHICGSLASHGIVVVAPDHRDGSSPINFIHTPDLKEKIKRTEYRRIDHKPSTDVYNARDEQLRIRLWEMGLIHDALLKIDTRQRLKNVAEDATKAGGKDMLTMFSHLLAVHEPGSISFAGHSFGAATTVQLVKSVYYPPTDAPSTYKPLFTPRASSALKAQITPQNPVILLDLWTLPLQSPATAWLRSQPMPSYASPRGGANLLAILSEGFYKWASNTQETKRTIARPASAPSLPGPHIFYPVASAHLSQSDFGVLFPWATAKVFGAREPARVLRLNARAVLQLLRDSGCEVASTSVADLEFEGVESGKEICNDDAILSTREGRVKGWVCIGEGADAGDGAKVGMGPGEAVLQSEAFGQTVEGK
ncbi:platelet-activating factor acetylhydrolase [Boeremia exigua]|uniref:platelet-activating factor acetylhydrolase n=1 Tax=Boeremia exigua TaxID=749465 RepID=UPI001E8EC2D7|nr:platelet-activating factor acetylhydrolase [Boeremia exigua]KAH6642978.1 platelet-activating factor acetylhydrolase [Boeremia exigua]